MVCWMTGRIVTACSTLMKPLDSVVMIDVATAVAMLATGAVCMSWV